MNKTDASLPRWTLIIGVFVVIFSATGARLKGIADGRSEARIRNQSPDRGGRADPHTHELEKTRKSSGGDSTSTLSAEKIHQRLWKIWQESPDPNYDPEARAMIGRLVATMSSAQIEEFLRSMPSSSERGPDFLLRSLVLQSWVLQDGPAAMRYVGTGKSADIDRLITTQIAMQWGSDQPDAAFAWMNDETLPPELKRRASNIRLNSLMQLMDTDQDRAFQELSRMKPGDVSKQLELWAGTHGTKPEVRERLLEQAAKTGNPEVLEEVRSTLVRVLAEKDPAAAKELVDSLATNGDRTALELDATLGRARKEPEAAFNEWLEKADVSSGIPESIVFGIGHWMWPEPDPVIKWLDDQPAGEKRDALYAASIPAVAGFERFDRAAKLVAAIESPDQRASALQALDLRWSLVNREAADKWRQALSPEDRAMIAR